MHRQKQRNLKTILLTKAISKYLFILLGLTILNESRAQIQREFEIQVSDSGLYFNGEQRTSNLLIDNPGFEYYFGRRITPHGDCIKKYGDFLFLTWYFGGEENKNVMLSRLHIPTQTLETIKFPHTHVGYQHKYPHIGDSHNTIAVGICPLDSTVHLLYDMHSYSKVSFPDTYFNYQASLKGAANAPLGSFNIDLFMPRQSYLNQAYNYSDITYPNFFLNSDNELFVWFREGGNNNGMYKFAKYDGNAWGPFTNFNSLNASNNGSAYNWGLYGPMKYINGKLRVGFLKRMSYNDDKYVYNNGFHYAYSNDPAGKTDWYNYSGEEFSLPLVKPEKIFFYEPGDVVTQGGANSVYIASGADFTVTDEEAVHFITNNVRSNVDGKSKNVHAFKKAADAEFTISTDFPGGDLFALEGNQVYLISMNNNRPEIYKADGGSNNWTKIYTVSNGILIEHADVLIADGKMFVYAMQKATGDARPIYIQMYDLDIDLSHLLKFKYLFDGLVIDRGTNLTVEANVGSAFTEVSLWLGQTNLGTLGSSPYIWSSHPLLADMSEASYTFRLVATDSTGAISEESITVYTSKIDELSTKTSLHISFEDEAIESWLTDGNDYGVSPVITYGSNTRAGSMVMELNYTGNTSGHHVQNTMDKILVPDQYYFHMIAYTSTSDITFGQTFPTALLGEWAPTPSFTGHSAEYVFERKVTSRQNTSGDSVNCYPRLRSKANGGACIIFYDDIVLYSDTNNTADLTAPTKAQNLLIVIGEKNSAEISWVPGVDSVTGVDGTLLFRAAELSTDSLELKPQVSYSTPEDNTSIPEVRSWSVIAHLPAETTSFTDKTRIEGERYKYAVVQKDVAFNYSVPLIGVEDVTKTESSIHPSLKCFGQPGSIEMKDLNRTGRVIIYNIYGIKVFDEPIKTSSLSVPVSPGIYIVDASGVVTKVIVI